MSSIDSNFIADLKNRILISEIIGKSVSLKPSGQARYKALCPFHNEKTPSFVINDNTQSFYCFGCSESGDVFSFLQKNDGYNFIDSIKYIADYAGVAVPQNSFRSKTELVEEDKDFEIITKFNDFFIQEYQKSNIAQEYIKKRDLAKDVIDKFSIGYAPTKGLVDNFVQENNFAKNKLLELGLFRDGSYGSYFLFSERLMFPIHNHSGKIVAFGGRILKEGNPKYINSPEYKFFKKRNLVYNFNRAKSSIMKQKQVMVCEGYMDVIALYRAGIENAVAPLGTSFSVEHLSFLWKYVDIPTICLDGDLAGRKAMHRIAEFALKELEIGKSLDFVILPEGKDPDDVLKQGKRSLINVLNKKKSLADIILEQFLVKTDISPEKKAKILVDLRALANNIQNKQIAKEYYQYFSSKFYDFFRNYKKSYQNNHNLLEKCKTNYQNEYISSDLTLMTFIILNNKLLSSHEKIEEEISLIEWNDENLEKTQSYLINNQELDIDKILLWLKNNISSFLFQIFDKKIQLERILQVKEEDLLKIWHYYYEARILEKQKKELNFLSDQAKIIYLSEIKARTNTLAELRQDLDL